MVQILHACAKTTEDTRKEIQLCQESLAKTAKKLEINPKTVIVAEEGLLQRSPMRPKVVKSTVLSEAEEEL